MISLTTITYDRLGYLTVNNMVETGALIHERRTSKAATLDGLASISDMGYTASDNLFVIKINEYTQAQIDRLIYLIKNYPLLRLVNADGVFIGVMDRVKTNLKPIEFNFNVKQQVA